MKILLVGNYPPPYGGISTHVQTLATRLEKEQQYKVQVLDVEVSKEKKQDGLLVPSSRIAFIRLLFSSLRFFDCVHLHTNGHNTKSWILILLVAIIAKFWKTKGVVTLHSGNCPAYIEGMGWLQRLFYLGCLRSYVKIIAVNSEICDLLEMREKLAGRVETIPAYVGLSCTPQKIKNEDLVSFLSRYPLIFSTVVAFRPEYGLETLLDFYKTWDRERSDTGFIIVGSGPGQEKLERQIEQRGLSGKIVVIKDLPPAEIYTVMKMSAIFIRATSYDGDSISVREALTLGVPVVATNTDFRPSEVVLFTISDAADLTKKISSVLTSCELSQRAGKKSHKPYDFFEQLVDIYENL